jgi:serine/threonine-protein phosphatase 5
MLTRWGNAAVESDYDGVRLENDMTKEFIEDMIQRFKTGKKIHKKYAYQIIIKAKEIFYNEPTMPEISVDEGKKLTVCGDTHGTPPSSHVKAVLT